MNMSGADLETRILDATKRCCDQWGFQRVTVEDIVAEAKVSRATVYRLFPGGRDVLFEALRVRERSEFFDALTAHVGDIEDFDRLVVELVVFATRALRADEHLAMLLASEPGEALSQLTVDGLPRIIATANDYLLPLVKPHLDDAVAPPLIDLLTRLTISYFLAPSAHVDLGDAESARSFLRPVLDLHAPHTT